MVSLRFSSWGAMLLAAAVAAGCGSVGPAGQKGEDGAKGNDGATGLPGADGPAGDKGPQGDPATVPNLVNDISGTVTDDAGAPLAGVTVSASPGTASATTAAAGTFTLSALPVGAYMLTFKLAGYLDQTALATVSMTGPTTVTVKLAVDASKLVPPALSITDQLNVGYGAASTVQVTATGGKTPYTYSWKQTTGPTATLTGADTDTISFTTQDLPTSLGTTAVANARFGALGINPDQANNYGFQVTVTDAAGAKATTSVTVNSTRPTTGLRNVPVGIPVWLQGAAGAASYSWSITTKPTTSTTAAISAADATAQFPSFTPDATGKYTVTEGTSGKTIDIWAGTWKGEMSATGEGNCTGCHTAGSNAPDMFTPFKNTAHYGALQRKLNGAPANHFSESCLPCHTVGYDKSADNGGFDDAQQGSGWTFPTKVSDDNWNQLQAVDTNHLNDLAGIQCENCHGPQDPSTGPHPSKDKKARISWSSSLCASCHQEAPHHYKPSQWDQGGHSNLELAVGEGAADNNSNAAHCGRCHSAQGFARYAQQLATGYYAYLTSAAVGGTQGQTKATVAEMTAIGMNAAEVESQTCQACHDPHEKNADFQLRVDGSVAVKALPNGMTNISGLGTGAICVACHNGRNGEHTDFATTTGDANGNMIALPYLTSFSGPHASAQADFVYGFNLYYMPRYSPSAHLAVGDSCAGCHVKVATDGETSAGETSNHAFKVDNTICKACHAANVDGEALQAANAVQLEGLRAGIAMKTLSFIKAAQTYAAGSAGATDVLIRAYDKNTDSYSSSSSSYSATATGWVSIAAKNIVQVNLAYAKNGTTPMFELVFGQTGGVQDTISFTTPAPANGNVTNATSVLVAFNATSIATNLPVTTGASAWTGTYYSVFSAPGPKSGTVIPAGGPYPAMPDPPPWDPNNTVQTLYKAYWNWYSLNTDKTNGIHNPTAFNNTIQATSAKLKALP